MRMFRHLNAITVRGHQFQSGYRFNSCIQQDVYLNPASI